LRRLANVNLNFWVIHADLRRKKLFIGEARISLTTEVRKDFKGHILHIRRFATFVALFATRIGNKSLIASSRGALRAIVIGIFSLLTIGIPLQGLAGASYIYDELGRVVQATYTDGAVIVYRYDANGNISAILRQSASALSIADVSPTVVHAGSLVTITGTGFSATATENAVIVGGAVAAVSTASATTLTVIVPAGANSGPVTVNVGSATAISPRSIVVLRPAISSFAPTQVAPGAAITLNGANLNLVPGTSVSIAGVNAAISSITNSRIVFAAPPASGPIKVSTSYGAAFSTGSLITIPAAIGAANVIASVPLTPGSSASLNINQPNKYGVFTFDGTANQYLSLQISSQVRVPSNSSVTYKFYSPSHALLISGTLSASSPTIHLPRLPATGTYLVAFSGTGTLQIQADLEIDTALAIDGTSASFSTTLTNQSDRYTFEATAGQNVGIGIRALSLPSDYLAYVTVYKPDGAVLAGALQCNENTTGCSFALRNLPVTGTYSIILKPATAPSTMSFRLTLSAPVQSALALDTPQSVSLLEGQFTLMPFTVAAGQTVALNVGSLATDPVGKYVDLDVLDSSGNSIGGTWTTSSTMTLNLRNMAAGTYRVQVAPRHGHPTTMQVTLASGVDSAVPADGTSTTFNTAVLNQNAYIKFSGTAGQNVGIGIRAISLPSDYLAYATVYKPDGAVLAGALQCNEGNGGCSFALQNLPVTGTYSIVLVPATAPSTMSFRLTLSAPVQSALALDTPQSVSLLEGQFTLMPFTVAAGQTVALNVGSLATDPVGKYVDLDVLDSSGNSISGASTNSSTMTLNLRNMAAGTYRVKVKPQNGQPATMQLTLASGVDSAVAVDGTSTTFNTTVLNQYAYITFAGTAGQNVGIGIRALSLPSDYSAYVTVYKPDGAVLAGALQCSESNGGCSFAPLNLPATGTYSIILRPATAPSTMSFRITLSPPYTTPITLGTPQSVTLTEGQFVWSSFTLAATQNVAATLSSYVTSPAGGGRTITVRNASGTSVGSTTGTTLSITNLAAGTYTLLITPTNGVSATMTMNVQ
jgi:YD repeat-containing protein